MFPVTLSAWRFLEQLYPHPVARRYKKQNISFQLDVIELLFLLALYYSILLKSHNDSIRRIEDSTL